MNEKCNVSVKTPVGETESFQLSRIEMQGTVTAPLKCAIQIDTLGRYCYTYNTGCYVYKDACYVPPLGMIDDVAAVSKCKVDSNILNSIINAKIETKKLQFNFQKCFNMHIGPNKKNCQSLKIHNHVMLKTEEQKYLGDIVSSSGNNNTNIRDRCNTGHGAISQIKSLMTDISLGRFAIQIGLILRDSIFISKMLLNSEVWHSVSKSNIQELEKVDKILLRNILDAHSKTPVEWMYADTGKLDLKSIIQIRRLMFLWQILSRNESELIHRVYQSQKISSNKGDWFRMIESDKKELDINMTDREIQGMSKQMFKTLVKKKVKASFIQHINSLKAKHSKSKYLECSELKTAEYIKDKRLNDKEKTLLFKLRSKTLNVKKNFGNNDNPWCTSCGIYTQGRVKV